MSAVRAYAVDAVAALLSAVLCVRASRLASPRGARAWRCQSAALACGAATALATALLPPPWRTIAADTGAVASSVLVAAGMWLTSRAPDARARVRMLLDGLTGATAAFVLLWTALLGPAWDAAPGDRHSVAAVLLPVAPLTLAAFYLFILCAEIPPGRRVMPVLLSSALLCDTVMQSARLLGRLGGDGPLPAVVHGGWLGCCALFAAAARTYRGTSVRRTNSSTLLGVGLAPYVLVAPALAVLLAHWLQERSLRPADQCAVAALVVLVTLRQCVTLAENRVLVARLAAREAELEHRATHDSLTGLATRSLLLRRLDEALEAGPAGVLLVDLDGFKQVNDTHGHAVGDALLVEVGRRLQAAVRETDLPARLGGDEFAVVVPGPPEATARAAAALCRELSAAYALGGLAVTGVGASVGTAHGSAADGATGAQLLVAADLEMYAAKRAGRPAGARCSTGPGQPARAVLG
ncbi:diguanylate cyclase (GGDEF)-like protein [Motilibacter peucedani]|uniref:Diguanylate cyclase (GGDEF)-like protein n=1 Tax=Motilibacter peucedani TaxID=598650 RepID=A0A420XTY1_9ACTN|nr:GGDEF domain-containing protein [Motilibacter peucedani]RKS80210.1 diguanylate cyclase (GGDEF)-like protein [Motilibacter peucedani]